MQQLIESIIGGIKEGKMFDSHYIIDKIIRDYSDDYLRFAAANLATGKVTEYAHSELAKIISSLEGRLVEQQTNKSVSYNIHGKSSECALWKRL
jgi:hypothetical protein